MITLSGSKRLLQTFVTLGCLVPLSAGTAGVLEGAHMLGTESAHDSGAHFRYLSGLLLAIGLGFLSTVPHIERRSARFRLLGFIVIIGGLSRLLGLWAQDASGPALWLPLLMELCITPLLCFWQARLAKAHDK